MKSELIEHIQKPSPEQLLECVTPSWIAILPRLIGELNRGFDEGRRQEAEVTATPPCVWPEGLSNRLMSVEEIKGRLVSLTEQERAIYLRQLRAASAKEYHDLLTARLDDKEPTHWVTPEEFEKRLDQH